MEKVQKYYQPHNTVRELIRDNNILLMVLSRFNIPFGFGDATVAQICDAHSVDTSTFLAVCNLLSSGEAAHYAVNLESLIGYLRRAHASFLEVSLPRIRQHLIEAINYADTDRVSYMLMKFFDDYVREVKRHMDHENNVVFRYAENLLRGQSTTPDTIASFSANHGNMAAKLRELKDLFIYHYKQAENIRMSETLFDIINCEKDMLAHFEVENRLFVPAVELLERRQTSSQPAITPAYNAETSPLSLLGEREKEIVKWVAKGRSNKEIADSLCISVHTVTTHRRNICSKLDIHSAAGLTIFAIIHGLVQIDEIHPS